MGMLWLQDGGLITEVPKKCKDFGLKNLDWIDSLKSKVKVHVLE